MTTRELQPTALDEAVHGLRQALRLVETTGHVSLTGYGSSRALAAIVANMLRAQGVRAIDLSPREARDWPGLRWLVSRSATCPGRPPHLLLTESGQSFEKFDALPCIGVETTEPSEAWFPLGFIEATLDVVARTFACPSPPAICADLDDRTEVLLVPDGGKSLRSLLTTAEHKLGPLAIDVCDVNEFGHGMHAQVAQSPHTHRLWLMYPPPPRPPIPLWVARLDIEMLLLMVTPTAARANSVYAGAMTLIELIRRRCQQRGIDPMARPIAEDLDGLRAHLAAEGRS